LLSALTPIADGVIGLDGESEDRDCYEVILQVQLNQKESKQNEVDGMKKETDSRGKVMHI